MQLQGNLKEFSLPNIFQLVKMSAKSGALTIRRADEWGVIYFRAGLINYAFAVPQTMPLGERLVKAGAITGKDLKAALAAQKKAGDGARIGSILLQHDVIDRETLEAAVRDQIQDTAFHFFSWSEGEFSFSAGDVADEDILVEMNVEDVIMEGCRRIDEWELIFEHLGSLERVPHLSYNERVEERGELTLTAQEWRVLVHINGRADINTILRDCGLDRFHGAKVMYSLYSSGLITVADAVIEAIGHGPSIAVRGPIDLYNEVFLNTLTDANVTKQLRVELVGGKEIEIPVIAGHIPAPFDGEHLPSPEEILVFTAASSSSEEAWKRLAGDASAWVLLANANDDDSLRAARRDVDFVQRLGGAPLVVATYVSMPEDGVAPKEARRVLGLENDVPVLVCHLRDRESVAGVVRAALELVPTTAPRLLR